MPASAAEPPTSICPTWPLSGAPPICSSSVAAEVSVRFPAMSSVRRADRHVAGVRHVGGGDRQIERGPGVKLEPEKFAEADVGQRLGAAGERDAAGERMSRRRRPAHRCRRA